MARIPEEELSRLKREVDLAALVRACGVELKPHGKDLLGLCPFHDDHEPSLVVTPAKNLWHCLGACRKGGTVVDWTMRAAGVSFRHAVELLRTGTVPTGPARAVKRSRVCRLDPVLAPTAEDQELLAQVVAYYHKTLHDSPEALAYLEERRIAQPEAVEHFQLGYSNRTLGYRLPFKSRKDGAAIRERLQALGVLRESGHEHFRGSLVIPIFDEARAVVGLYGRKVGKHLRPGTPLHLYLPGPHRGVWNVEAFAASDELILTESLIDALTFWCAGFRNVTASYGIEGFTEEHLDAFQRYKTKKVLIAYDHDAPGQKAAQDLACKLVAAGMVCHQVLFPLGADPNDVARLADNPTEVLGAALRAAVGAGHVEPPIGGRGADAANPGTGEAGMGGEDGAGATPPPAPPSPVAAPSPPALPLAAASEAPHSPPTPSAASQATDDELRFEFGPRRWRVRGLAKNTSYEALKVNLLVAESDRFHVDSLDLYAARTRAAFLKEASLELSVKDDVLKTDLGKILLGLEERLDAAIRQALEPASRVPTLTDAQRAAALELLQDPCLLDRILADLAACGVVGEETNKLVAYLAATSRKLPDPLAVVVQSSSSAGKSTLMDAILAFVPSEDRVKYSAVTGQALFYMGESNLAHKVLAIVEEAGAERAGYALKLLQSEGELSIASTGKDPSTGRLVTQEYHVAGPVMIFLTTTSPEVDEELANRALVLSVSETREQTAAIHALQRTRETLPGQLARQDRAQVHQLHQNAQRLLRPLVVANPYAQALTFLDDRTRTRRDHAKYLTLIRTIAYLHQYQRPVLTTIHAGKAVEYVEVTIADIATANQLAAEVLGRSLDELAPPTRRFLGLLDQLVARIAREEALDRAQVRFTRRQVREYSCLSEAQTRLHLDRLLALEYVLAHRGSRGQQFVYELLYDGEGQDGTPFLPGLLDVEALRTSTTPHLAAKNAHLAGTSWPVRGGFAATSRSIESPENPHNGAGFPPNLAEPPENASREPEFPESYRSPIPSFSLAALAAGS